MESKPAWQQRSWTQSRKNMRNQAKDRTEDSKHSTTESDSGVQADIFAPPVEPAGPAKEERFRQRGPNTNNRNLVPCVRVNNSLSASSKSRSVVEHSGIQHSRRTKRSANTAWLDLAKSDEVEASSEILGIEHGGTTVIKPQGPSTNTTRATNNMIGYIRTIRCLPASKMRRDEGYIGTNNSYTGRQRQHKNVKTHLGMSGYFSLTTSANCSCSVAVGTRFQTVRRTPKLTSRDLDMAPEQPNNWSVECWGDMCACIVQEYAAKYRNY
jgi:hypothetical protein